jgi:FKBP-type peptidyl-prolyl cis-trans isomerase FklB
MKVILTTVVAAAVLAGCSNQIPEINGVTAESNGDSTSYAIGLQIGKSFREQGIEVDSRAFIAGIQDAIGEKPLFPDSVVQKVLMSVQEKAMKKMQENEQKKQAEMAKGADSIRKIGNDFLAKNKTKAGVTTTASGLQYEVIKQGNGPRPTASQTVVVHYTGMLIDGKVFDSSVQRGQPAEFPVGGVIPGFSELLQLMPEGSKFKAYLPNELAYGPQGSDRIPPGSVLVFEVELLGIKK